MWELVAMTLVPGFQTNLPAWDAQLNFQESALFAGRSRGSNGGPVQLSRRAIDPGSGSRGQIVRMEGKVSPQIRVSGVLKLAVKEERTKIMAMALQDQEMRSYCLASAAMERSSSGAALEDKVGGAFQHRDSSSPSKGSASCLSRSPSVSETESFVRGDSIGSLRGFSGLYMDRTRSHDEIVESEEENFSAAAPPNFQVEKWTQFATNHENSRSWSFSATPPRRKRLPAKFRNGVLIEAFSDFPPTERNDEIYTSRIEKLQSRVLVAKSRRLFVVRKNATLTSRTVGIVHLAEANRKKSETAVGHGIAKHPWVDFINLTSLDVKRCKGRLPTNSLSTAIRIVSATTDQHHIQDHNENIPFIAGVAQEKTIGHPARTSFVLGYVQVTTRKNVIRVPRGMVQDGDMITVEDAGEPNIPCDSCKGKGWLVCDFCEGQKVNVQSPRNNRIYRRCPNCRAVGVVICPRCKVFKCVSCSDEKDAGVTP